MAFTQKFLKTSVNDWSFPERWDSVSEWKNFIIMPSLLPHRPLCYLITLCQLLNLLSLLKNTHEYIIFWWWNVLAIYVSLTGFCCRALLDQTTNKLWKHCAVQLNQHAGATNTTLFCSLFSFSMEAFSAIQTLKWLRTAKKWPFIYNCVQLFVAETK